MLNQLMAMQLDILTLLTFLSQVLLGDMGAGKTSLVLRFVKGQFYEFQESTIGAAFFTQVLSLNEGTIKFDIWDTAGQERYHSLAPMYYRGAAAAVVVYDITSMDDDIWCYSYIRPKVLELSFHVTKKASVRIVSTEDLLAIFFWILLYEAKNGCENYKGKVNYLNLCHAP
ncbi:hypothetical protein RHGRI_037001 [Rhododendron griersonianum]|uniref:Uncharacterized protein n=1 Tax=Rhododendron griersonianum TaxID=479676 RepID=A0AAV6HVW0_9ERIC|nr:hypothetical protein RHGRI_037001 [Rhododendron griersonianum]